MAVTVVPMFCPHDDGDGGGIADRAGGGERLQDADGGGAGLDDAGEHRADQHAEDRISEGKEQIRERGDLREPETAPLIVSMPNMSVAKPRRMVPVSFFFASLQNI